MSRRLTIGISACFFHADPHRPIFAGKTLQYVEQSIAHWAQSQAGERFTRIHAQTYRCARFALANPYIRGERGK